MAGTLLAALRFKQMLVNNRAGIFQILIFHDISNSKQPALDRLIPQIERTHGILTPGEAENWLKGNPMPGPCATSVPCLITFDDGFDSNADVAGRILARHGVKSIFFVCPGLIDLELEEQREKICANIFDGRISPAELPTDKKLMNWEQLIGMQEAGHKIGAHGMSHRRLTSLKGDELRDEIVLAGEIIEERLQSSADWYAHAFGDISSISSEAVKIIFDRYRYFRSGIRGANAGISPSAPLLAEEVDLSAPTAYQELIMAGGLDFAYGKKRKKLASMRQLADQS